MYLERPLYRNDSICTKSSCDILKAGPASDCVLVSGLLHTYLVLTLRRFCAADGVMLDFLLHISSGCRARSAVCRGRAAYTELPLGGQTGGVLLGVLRPMRGAAAERGWE